MMQIKYWFATTALVLLAYEGHSLTIYGPSPQSSISFIHPAAVTQTKIDDIIRYAVSGTDELAATAAKDMKELVPATPDELRAHHVSDSCNGVWMGHRIALDQDELYAEYNCVLDGKKNGPYSRLEAGALREKGTYANNIETSYQHYTGYAGEKPDQDVKLVGQQDGYSLYAVKEIKCQAARAVENKFIDPKGKSPSVQLTYTDGSPQTAALKDVFAYKAKKDKDLEDPQFTQMRLFEQSIQSRASMQATTKTMLEKTKWSPAPASNSECAASGGKWFMSEQAGKNATKVIAYSCQKDGTFKGPYERRVINNQGQEVLREVAHIKEGLMTDDVETVPNGEWPIRKTTLVNENYNGYALYDTTESTCQIAHRTSIDFTKGADGKFTMKRTGQDGNAKAIEEPPVPVADIIQQLKNPPPHKSGQGGAVGEGFDN